ncbi:MAG: deaminase [Nanoarchaeota archaeon]
MNIILGLTGTYCAGKDTVGQYLTDKSFYHYSLSDFLREELKKQGKEIIRDNLIALGNELRAKHGPGVLGEMAIKMTQSDKNYVISSIRNPEEVKALKKHGNFVLVNVDAPSKIRFDRLAKRKRENDPKTFEDFVKYEQQELNSPDPNAQQIRQCISMADLHLINDLSLEDLYKKVDIMLEDVLKIASTKRPSWDEYFMKIAKSVSIRSNCMKRHVAAIIVKDRRIISTGYNGTPRGVKNCNEGGCARCNSFAQGGAKLDECVCSHGEENAIVQASYHGISLKDSTLYTTFAPCLMCAKMIINSGIKEVIYNLDYPLNDLTFALLQKAGTILRQHKIE